MRRSPSRPTSTAAALADALSHDQAHFQSVRRPDASPYFDKNGLLFLDLTQLTAIMDRTIDAQPFLGQLVADPTARGLFSALALLGVGVTKGGADLTPYLDAIRAFHAVLADAAAGKPRPLSWQKLLGAGLSDLAGKYRFVLIQPKQDFGALQPGGAATAVVRQRHQRTGIREIRRRARAHHRSGRAWPMRSSPPSRKARSRG